MIRLQKRIREGECRPRGYGLAWRDLQHFEYVCYPLPLNVLFGLARRAYFWFLVDWWPLEGEWERKLRLEIRADVRKEFQVHLDHLYSELEQADQTIQDLRRRLMDSKRISGKRRIHL